MVRHSGDRIEYCYWYSGALMDWERGYFLNCLLICLICSTLLNFLSCKSNISLRFTKVKTTRNCKTLRHTEKLPIWQSKKQINKQISILDWQIRRLPILDESRTHPVSMQLARADNGARVFNTRVCGGCVTRCQVPLSFPVIPLFPDLCSSACSLVSV